MASKVERSHSWDSTFRSLKLKSMKKRENQVQTRRRGFGVRERHLHYENREEQDETVSSSRPVLWNQNDAEEMEDEPPPLAKEVRQQMFMQRLFVISKMHLDETPPERRMSLLSIRSPEGTFSDKELEPPTRQPSLLTALQASYLSGQQTSGQCPSKPTTNNQVSHKSKQRHQPWTVETVVTNLTSSCTAFDSLCTPTISLLTSARTQQRQRNGPDGPTPAIPPSKRRPCGLLEEPIPIPVTISFTKQGPPPGWEDLSSEKHFAELEKYGDISGDVFDDTDLAAEDRQKDDEADHASSSGFISLTSSIPTRRSHGLWSTSDLR